MQVNWPPGMPDTRGNPRCMKPQHPTSTGDKLRHKVRLCTIFSLFFSDETTMYKISFLIAMYSLRPKKQVTLGFKICPKKHVILPYLESACMQESISAKYG